MTPTCGHRNLSWRVVVKERPVLMCWNCVLEEIQESKIDQPIMIVRECD